MKEKVLSTEKILEVMADVNAREIDGMLLGATVGFKRSGDIKGTLIGAATGRVVGSVIAFAAQVILDKMTVEDLNDFQEEQTEIPPQETVEAGEEG